MSGGSGGGNDTTVNTTSEPYAPAMPALNQIIGEAGTIYGAGPNYVAPNALTMEGLASQESMGRAANTQLADTVAGKYSNPFFFHCCI